MRTLGLRVAPSEVTFCIYCSDENEVINIEKICVPNALLMPEKLKYIRATILDVLREYEVEKAGLKLTEPSARQVNIDRVQIEGVIQEAFASSLISSYYQGPIATVASKAGIVKTQYKPLVKGSTNFERVDNWSDFSEKEREAIIVALGAVHV